MIQIDMPMPNSCMECRFRDPVQSGCNAAEEPGFCVFVGLSETEIVEWGNWKRKISSGRDPRCPLKQECKGCSTIFDVAYKAGKDDSIVRCKDCEWYEPTPDEDEPDRGWCSGICNSLCAVHDEWFCADGKRR